MNDAIGPQTTVAAAVLVIAAFVAAVAVLYPGCRAMGAEVVPAGDRRARIG